MTNDLADQIASTLEADPCLLPFMPELLADLNELGASADDVVSALRRAGLGTKATVLDLGCGKGAVAVALAERLGCHVEGVDAFLPFVETARATAASRGVEARCIFRQADLRTYLGQAAQYDAVLLLSMGPVAGSHQQTMEGLRQLVRPGGYVVIDDAFLAEGVGAAPGYEAYAGHADTLRQLTAFGDHLVDEQVAITTETQALNRANTELIRQRAARIKAQQPDLADLLNTYVDRQERETRLLGTDVTGALWVLQRA